MRRFSFCSLLLATVLCTTAANAQGVKISQAYGGGGNTFAPLSNDYIEIYNSGPPQDLTGWSVQYASSTGTFSTATTASTALPAVILGTGQYLLISQAAGVLISPQAVSLPAAQATGAVAMSATDFKIALVSSTAALSSGTPTYAGNPTLVDFVGAGTLANWNDTAAAGGAFAAANNAPPPSTTLAIYRNDCGAQDTNSSRNDWAHGAPSPRNTATPLNLGMSAIGSVFPYIARQGTTVSLRCSPRLCGTNAPSPGTTVMADLSLFGLGVVAMSDAVLAGDDLAGDNLFMLNVTIPAAQAAASYQLPITVSDGTNSGGAYLGVAVVASATTPANDNCSGAIALTVGVPVAGTLFTGANVESNPAVTSLTAPTTGMSSRRGLWYSVVGTGNTMTASSCGTTVAVDTVLMVFCGSCDGLSIAATADAAASQLCPTSENATFCSTAGQTYLIWVAPFGSGAVTTAFTITVTDNAVPCTTAMPCTTCIPGVAAVQTEVEQSYGTSTNDGCATTPNGFTNVTPALFPTINAFNGTAKGLGGNRDLDAYRFMATTNDLITATVTGQAEGYQITLNQLGPGGACPQTTVALSPLSARCGTASLTSAVLAGNWYTLQVICVGIQGNPPGAYFGGSVPSGGTHNYTATLQIGGVTPTNDTCATAPTITAGSVVVGSTAGTTNDTAASCDAGGRDVWYSITTTAVGTLVLDTLGSPIDTALAVFDSCGGLELACNDDCAGCQGSGTFSCITMPGLAAGTYKIRVSDKGLGSGGLFFLRAFFDAVGNDFPMTATPVACGTVLLAQTNVGATSDAAFVPAGCTGPQAPGITQSFTYTSSNWYSITGTGDTIYVDTLAGANYDSKIFVWTGSTCASLTCVTMNDDIEPAAAGFGSKVAWKSNLGQAYYVMVGPFGTAAVGSTYTLTVSCAPTPANDNCAAPQVLSPVEGGSVAGTTAGATCSELYTSTTAYPSCAGTSPAVGGIFDVWYSYTACANGNLMINTCGAFNTLLSVHTACPGLAGPNNQIAGACNNDGTTGGCPPGSELTVAVTSGTTYLIRVAGAIGANPEGAFTLTWTASGVTWYQDADGDTFGNPAVSQVACLAPVGYVSNNQDCNDANPAINPLAAEVCDTVDNDCDSLIDDADPGIVGQSTWYQDSDGDTYGNAGVSQLACFQPVGYVSNDDDCDDTNGAVNPGASEVCNGIDDDCDTLIDDGDPSVVGQGTWYQDSDGDTYGNPSVSVLACVVPVGYVPNNQDCDDTNAAVNPAATEICNGIDDDCDTQIDEVCPSNDNCVSATSIGDGPVGGDSSIAGSEITDLTCGAVTNDVWYMYSNSLTCPKTVTASLCGIDGGSAAFPAVIHVFDACGGTLIGCDAGSCGGSAKITFTVAGGASVKIAVSAVAPGPGGLFTMVVSSKTASFSTVGLGCSAGPLPGPTLTIDAAPVLGTVRTVTLAGAAPASTGFLFMSNPAGAPSPLFGGCNLYLDQGSIVFLVFLVTDGTGSWSLVETVPSSPFLECAAVTVQAFVFPVSGTPSYQVSDGLGLVLGY